MVLWMKSRLIGIEHSGHWTLDIPWLLWLFGSRIHSSQILPRSSFRNPILIWSSLHWLSAHSINQISCNLGAYLWSSLKYLLKWLLSLLLFVQFWVFWSSFSSNYQLPILRIYRYHSELVQPNKLYDGTMEKMKLITLIGLLFICFFFFFDCGHEILYLSKIENLPNFITTSHQSEYKI